MPSRERDKAVTLRRRVLGFIWGNRLLENPCTLLVGISGGPDSVCLLHLLSGFREELGLKIHIGHLNHQLRGVESEADAEYVSNLTNKLGIPLTIGRKDVRGYQEEKGGSLEEAARDLRYHFLASLAEEIGAEAVALGHTADDQVETLLLHLVRGSGLSGLRGMRPSGLFPLSGKKLRLIRPLLQVSREETQAYCSFFDLSPRLDSSNLSYSFLRNRIRLELLPLLENYNPNIRTSLLRTANLAAEDLEFIEDAAFREWERIIREESGGLWLNNRAFSSLPSSLKHHLLRKALGSLVGELRDVQLSHIESLAQAMISPVGKRLSLPRGLSFYGGYEESWLGYKPPPSPFPPLKKEQKLVVPGETKIPGWRILTSLTQARAEEEESGFSAHFDFDSTGSELFVRKRRPGDRFQPLGMEQPKKLQDFMVDAKIPRVWRDQVPLVCAGEEIIWVVGWRLSQRFRVNEKTHRILRLKFQRTENA